MIGRLLWRRALLKGVLGGSGAWTGVWIALAGFRLVRRFTGGRDEVVYRGRLEPGEALVISSKDREPKVFSL